MSNIYIQEPPTNGKVLLKTTVGDIDLELWSKETPKACRNFVQLCMEGYYNDTIFHRVVKGFIIQGGDPTGTGNGGDSIYGHPFKDEFHSRLRFNRRGLLAMANAGRDDNASQFFFTVGATPELQSKHTIFGKLTGETVFNMLKLEDALVDKDDRPVYPQKIIKTEVLSNPFPDIVPRITPQTEPREEKKKREKKTGVKNFKLLSFGEEAEEDEEEMAEANKKFSGRSKSTHDILDDPKLSSQPAVRTKRLGSGSDEDSDALSGDDRQTIPGKHLQGDRVDSIRKKLKKQTEPEATPKNVEESDEPEYFLGKDRMEEMKKKADDIRKQIKDLKRGLANDKKNKEEEKEEEERKNKEMENETLIEYNETREKYVDLKSKLPMKGNDREQFTLALLAKFQNKLAMIKEKSQEGEEVHEEPEEASNDDEEDGEKWLAHRLQFESNTPVLAKDASTKEDDWFEIYDPRNPINKRRREASKDAMRNKAKK